VPETDPSLGLRIFGIAIKDRADTCRSYHEVWRVLLSS
jgi:hypothetical protein